MVTLLSYLILGQVVLVCFVTSLFMATAKTTAAKAGAVAKRVDGVVAAVGAVNTAINNIQQGTSFTTQGSCSGDNDPDALQGTVSFDTAMGAPGGGWAAAYDQAQSTRINNLNGDMSGDLQSAVNRINHLITDHNNLVSDTDNLITRVNNIGNTLTAAGIMS